MSSRKKRNKTNKKLKQPIRQRRLLSKENKNLESCYLRLNCLVPHLRIVLFFYIHSCIFESCFFLPAFFLCITQRFFYLTYLLFFLHFVALLYQIYNSDLVSEFFLTFYLRPRERRATFDLSLEPTAFSDSSASPCK